MNMPLSLTPDLRAKLDAHLDAVEKALIAAGSSRERRRGVLDDLEAQILDMLAGKSDHPTLPDLDAVLATLDPPAAYAQTPAGDPLVPPTPPTPPKPRYSRTAIWGFYCILISLLPLPLILMMVFFYFSSIHPSSHTYSSGMRPVELAIITTGPQSLSATTTPLSILTVGSGLGSLFGFDGCILLIMFPFGLLGTVLGWVAFFQIRHSHGLLRGIGLALFDGMFYPTIVILLLLVTVILRLSIR